MGQLSYEQEQFLVSAETLRAWISFFYTDFQYPKNNWLNTFKLIFTIKILALGDNICQLNFRLKFSLVEIVELIRIIESAAVIIL